MIYPNDIIAGRTEMTGLEYGLFDCDTHCYETRDSFTRYLPK
jgi:hypothetical protein